MKENEQSYKVEQNNLKSLPPKAEEDKRGYASFMPLWYLLSNTVLILLLLGWSLLIEKQYYSSLVIFSAIYMLVMIGLAICVKAKPQDFMVNPLKLLIFHAGIIVIFSVMIYNGISYKSVFQIIYFGGFIIIELFMLLFCLIAIQKRKREKMKKIISVILGVPRHSLSRSQTTIM